MDENLKCKPQNIQVEWWDQGRLIAQLILLIQIEWKLNKI